MAVATLQAGANPPAVRRSVITALAIALTALTGAAVLSAGWTDGSLSALLMGVAGAVEAAALVRTRLPRAVALTAPLLLLLLTVMVPTVGTVPVPPHSGILTVLHEYVVAGASGLLGNAQWQFNVGLGALLWACGAWLMEVSLRGRRGAAATAPVWAILAVNVINAPAPGNAATASLVAAVTAVILIAAVHLERLSSGWRRRGMQVLPGTDTRFAACGAVGGLVILLLALVLPPVTSSDISGRLFSTGTGTGTGNGSTHGAADLSGTVRFNRATVPGGPLAEANTPVMTYVTGVNGGAYLRMATDTVFVDGTWLPDEDAISADLVQETIRPGPIQRDRVLADGGVGSEVQPVSSSILMTNDTSGDNTLPFPGEPDAVSVQARVSGLNVAGSLSGFLTIDSVRAASPVVGVSLTTTGTQSAATAAQLRAAGTNYPAYIGSGGFLDLPNDGGDGTARIRALALQWTRGMTNPYDEATAIENALRDPQQFHYTLDPTLPPPGSTDWPIVYFLTSSHAGYCQYFASSMGALLRSIGIPARLVNGYGPGAVIDSANAVGGNGLVRQVTSNDAHTWVEAYFPTYGWIPFEPTPPSSQGVYLPFQRGGSASASTPPAAPRATARAGGRATPRGALAGDSAAAGSSGGAGGLVLPVALGLGALALLLALAAAWLARPRGLPGVWRRVRLAGRLLGTPRDPSQTLDEFLARVAAVLPSDAGRPRGATAARAALAEIGLLSNRALYARGSPSAEEAARLRGAWRRVALLLPLLTVRTRTRRSATP